MTARVLSWTWARSSSSAARPLETLFRAGTLLAQTERRLAIARPDRQVVKMLKIMGLQRVLPHFRTLDEAQAWVAR